MKEQQKTEKKNKSTNKNIKNHSSAANAIENLSASSSNLNISNVDEKASQNTTNEFNEADTISMVRRNANENRKKETGVSKALANLKSDREKKKKIGM